MASRKKPSAVGSFFMILFSAILLGGIAGGFTYWLIPVSTGVVEWKPIILKGMASAVVATGVLVGLLSMMRDTIKARPPINGIMLVGGGVAIAAVFGVFLMERHMLNAARAAVEPVFQKTYEQLSQADMAYRARLKALGVITMMEPDQLARFNAGEARTALTAARDLDAAHAPALRDIVKAKRAELMAAMPAGRRRDSVMAKFDREFVRREGIVEQMAAYETYRLSVLDYDLAFMTRTKWQIDGRGWVMFYRKQDMDLFAAERAKRAGIESYLNGSAFYLADHAAPMTVRVRRR